MSALLRSEPSLPGFSPPIRQDPAVAPAFEVQGAGKIYPGVVALHPVTLAIRRGEKVAIVGPSGSGKTTLLHLLGGVVQPDCGRILVEGRLLASLRSGRDLARLVGVMHQQFDLVPHLPVVHNVLAGRLGDWSLLRSIVSLLSPRDLPLAIAALRRVGIAEKLYERTSRLSGGEQQRVALARVLVQNPSAILADEPVSSLDPARAEDLLQMLADIVDGEQNTLVASLHSIAPARRHFSRIIGLRNGRVQFDLPAAEVGDRHFEQLYDLDGLAT